MAPVGVASRGLKKRRGLTIAGFRLGTCLSGLLVRANLIGSTGCARDVPAPSPGCADSR
jgi:hypothetical protein